jgi:CRP-like cAMP-binding protein
MNTLNLFRNEPTRKTFLAGETIFAVGEQGADMYAILEGEVDILINGQLMETDGPGDFFGEMALVEKEEPRSATAVARTDCAMVLVDETRFLNLVAGNPWFAIHVMRVMARRLRRMNELE